MRTSRSKRIVAFALFAVMAVPAFAQPPWAKGGAKDKDRGDERAEHVRGKKSDKRERHFKKQQHAAVREYYSRELQHGSACPPGLAKKHNGCMPPGQARKWKLGQPLPADVVRYEVPPELVVKIGIPPAGYKYVRVASDILMVAVGTSIVADAIRDLGRQ